MYGSLKKRLSCLEQGFKPFTAGIVIATFKDGHKQRLLWTDAMQAALEGLLVDVEGDADDSLSGLVKMFIA